MTPQPLRHRLRTHTRVRNLGVTISIVVAEEMGRRVVAPTATAATVLFIQLMHIPLGNSKWNYEMLRLTLTVQNYKTVEKYSRVNEDGH